MCNAYNHPADCQCGFGGEGHLGRRTFSRYDVYSFSYERISISNVLFDKKKENSYTIPNAKCPVCGEKVFFFRSENGGCAYFDELGPPWPKHPCIIDSRYILQVREDIHDFLPPVLKNPFTNWSPTDIYYIDHIKLYTCDGALVNFKNILSKRELSLLVNLSAEILENGIFSIKAMRRDYYSLECFYIDSDHKYQSVSLTCYAEKKGSHMRMGQICRKSKISMEKLISILKEDFFYDDLSCSPGSKISKEIGEKIIKRYREI